MHLTPILVSAIRTLFVGPPGPRVKTIKRKARYVWHQVYQSPADYLAAAVSRGESRSRRLGIVFLLLCAHDLARGASLEFSFENGILAE